MMERRRWKRRAKTQRQRERFKKKKKIGIKHLVFLRVKIVTLRINTNIFDLSRYIHIPRRTTTLCRRWFFRRKSRPRREGGVVFLSSRHAAASGSSFSRDHQYPEPAAGESILPRMMVEEVLSGPGLERRLRIQSSSPPTTTPTVSVSAAQIQLVGGRFGRRGRREEKASWTNRFWVRSEDARGFWVERRVQTFSGKARMGP